MILDWLLALAPILLVLILMLGLRWKGIRAGPAGWLVAVLIAALRFGAGWQVLLWAQIRAFFLALWVLYIIWSALLFYRVTDEAGVIGAIGAGLPRLTTDRALQVLLLGWIFGAFLQSMSGFGVPVAVLGPLLVGLGFSPVAAVLIASVGHSWAITFGSLGSSFYALMAATGRPGKELAGPSAAMLALCCLLCGAGVLWVAGKWRLLRRGLAPMLVIGLAMSGTQYLAVTHGLWTIGALCGVLAGLAVAVLWSRIKNDHKRNEEMIDNNPVIGLRWAVVPYALLVLIVLSAELIGPVNQFLGQVVVRVEAPELVTARGWIVPAGAARTINVFGHAGALLIYTSLITGLVFWLRGAYRPGTPRRIAGDVVRRAIPSSVGIATMVGLAVTMSHAGMTHLLADGISQLVGQAFPLASPFIGALGAFMTGSNTNSNVVFSMLQEQVAVLVGMSPLLALAAQTAGGAIGSMFAPAKVIVGCAPVGADEGQTMRQTMAYGGTIIVVLALVTGALSLVL
jgi:lactate permease